MSADHQTDADGNHISPISMYMKVYGALLVLTVITYAVSFADLGPFSLPAAMIVAVLKATLVVLFFMHLLHDDKFNSLILLVSMLFMGIFFAFTMLDVGARDLITPVESNYYMQYEKMPERNEAIAREVIEQHRAGGGHGDDHGHGHGEDHGDEHGEDHGDEHGEDHGDDHGDEHSDGEGH